MTTYTRVIARETRFGGRESTTPIFKIAKNGKGQKRGIFNVAASKVLEKIGLKYGMFVDVYMGDGCFAFVRGGDFKLTRASNRSLSIAHTGLMEALLTKGEKFNVVYDRICREEEEELRDAVVLKPIKEGE